MFYAIEEIMTPIGERIGFEVREQMLILRIKKAVGSVLVTTLCAAFFYLILNWVWVLAFALLHGGIEFFGFTDYIFDQSSGLFRKRYGIGGFTLGDSIRLPLEDTQIQATLTCSYCGDFPVYDTYLIQILNEKQKIELYASQDLDLIKTLFDHLQFSGAKTVEWQIEEKTTA